MSMMDRLTRSKNFGNIAITISRFNSRRSDIRDSIIKKMKEDIINALKVYLANDIYTSISGYLKNYEQKLNKLSSNRVLKPNQRDTVQKISSVVSRGILHYIGGHEFEDIDIQPTTQPTTQLKRSEPTHVLLDNQTDILHNIVHGKNVGTADSTLLSNFSQYAAGTAVRGVEFIDNNNILKEQFKKISYIFQDDCSIDEKELKIILCG